MGIAPELLGPGEPSNGVHLAEIRNSSILTPRLVETILKKMNEEENTTMNLSVATEELRASWNSLNKTDRLELPSVFTESGSSVERSLNKSKQMSLRKHPCNKSLDKAAMSQETRRVLEKFLARSLSMNDASPMKRFYGDLNKQRHLAVIEESSSPPQTTQEKNSNHCSDLVEESAPVLVTCEKTSGAKTPEFVTPPETPLVEMRTLVTEVNHDKKDTFTKSKPCDMRKIKSDPLAYRITQHSSIVPSNAHRQTVIALDRTLAPDTSNNVDCLHIPENNLDTLSPSGSNDHSPMLRPKSAVIAQSEFSVVDFIESGGSLPGSGDQSARNTPSLHSLNNFTELDQYPAKPPSVIKAETISTSSYEQYLKEMQSTNNNKKKSNGHKPVKYVPSNSASSIQKSMTISTSSYQEWKTEQKQNGKTRQQHSRTQSRESELDFPTRSSTMRTANSGSISSLSSIDSIRQKKERKKKSGFKKALERLRHSYRRKQDRPSSIHSADYYSVKPKITKPMFKKKKKQSLSIKFWKKKGSSSDTERDKIKTAGLNDPRILEDSDDAKKGVLIRNKQGGKGKLQTKTSEENVFDNLLRQFRKTGLSLRRRISQKDSSKDHSACKSRSLDILDEAGSDRDSPLPRSHDVSPRSKSSNSSSPRNEVTEQFANILESKVTVRVSPASDESLCERVQRLPPTPAPPPPTSDGNKDVRDKLKLQGLVTYRRAVSSDLEEDGPGVHKGSSSVTSPSNKPLLERTEEEKEMVYDKVAKKLAEIADQYVQKVESSSEPTSPLSAAIGGDSSNPLDRQIAGMLREHGDNIYANGEFPTEIVKAIIDNTTYSTFTDAMSATLPQSNRMKQIAVLFHMTKKAVDWVGIGAKKADQIKEMSLRFFEDKFADWIMGHGGWDSMGESDFELD